jgi:competence protein ComGD
MKMANKHGFTLAELIIVLGILAIMWAVVSLSMDGLRRQSLNSASLTLQADIRYAQQMAIMEGRRWQVDFDIENNSYTIRRDSILDTADYRRDVILPNGVTIEVNFKDQFLHYTSKGTVNRAGTIWLRSGSFMQRSTVALGTGRVRVFEITSH